MQRSANFSHKQMQPYKKGMKIFRRSQNWPRKTPFIVRRKRKLESLQEILKLPSTVGSIWVENLLSDPAYPVWFVIVLMRTLAAVRSTAADNVISNTNNTRKRLQEKSCVRIVYLFHKVGALIVQVVNSSSDNLIYKKS